MRKATENTLAVFGLALGLLFMSGKPAMANHIDSAILYPTCNSFTISVSASDLNPGEVYEIQWAISVTDTCAMPGTANYSITCTAPSNGSFSATLPNSMFPFNNEFPSRPCPLTFSGTASLVNPSDNSIFNTIPLTFSNGQTSLTVQCPSPTPTPTPPPVCTAQSTNSANFNGTPIKGGDYIWFNANFTANNIPSSGTTLYLTNSTIQLTADQPYTVQVPNAQITFSPSATCATTTYDLTTNTWMTTVPINAGDEVFLSGVAFPVPASFANVNGHVSSPVVWQGTFGTSNTPNVNVQWKWGAAVYTCFTTNYNSLNVKPTHQNACNLNNGDHAGTPENTQYQQCVTGGAGGGGGSNFTGSWSGTLNVTPQCP